MLKKIILSSLLGTGSFVYANINVMVSILPQQTFVEKIGGDKVHVTTMVKPGSDPHSYEPKPSQMIALSQAKLYFPIRIEFENAWLPKFKEHNAQMQFVEMTQGVKFLKMPTHTNELQNLSGLPFEWTGAFDLKKGEYRWSFAKVGGKYADPKMKFLMIKAGTQDEDLIELYENEAKLLFETAQSTAKDDDSIDANKKTYSLTFDETQNQTIFKLSIQEDGTYLFFTEHMPFEFEDKEHFLKDLAGNDIEPVQTKPESNGGHHHHHGGVDPHTWTAPSNVKIMAKNIYETLIKIDIKNSAYYKKNYETFLEEIEQTDKKIKEIFTTVPQGSKFMVFHPSWGYFANEYGLVQLSIEVEGKEPKPKTLRKIIDKARQENIKAVFTQQEFSEKSAKALARELGIKVIKETPLAKEWSSNLLKMVNAIANTN
ncbi:MAG: Zinc ABC transporter, periplasmic-binding protein ZnuA [uncultured Sulfurovum sp.]|uniref:Zinc ABC transporter, periplasmic-binding protein ZnuA n=1 Tax=uncultured Sulfurovum sp. TaxID=269237 RepID=A0A6S6SF16_9BACT|nr:MAG: Zinc ABC transporter, periplasmic-binding protein ZnuA [uncultured Sulfurovum sp.]